MHNTTSRGMWVTAGNVPRLWHNAAQLGVEVWAVNMRGQYMLCVLVRESFWVMCLALPLHCCSKQLLVIISARFMVIKCYPFLPALAVLNIIWSWCMSAISRGMKWSFIVYLKLLLYSKVQLMELVKMLRLTGCEPGLCLFFLFSRMRRHCL